MQFQVILQQDQKFRDVNQWSELIVFTYKKSISIFFVPFIRRCVHHNYDVISGSHACRDCVWHIILDAELCTTCRGEGVLVATRFNVTFLPRGSVTKIHLPVSRKMQKIQQHMVTCFDAVRLFVFVSFL